MVGVDYKLAGRQRRKGRTVPKMGRGRRGERVSMTGWDPELITPEQINLAKPLMHVARLVFTLVKNRVFREYKRIDGAPLGVYSNRPPRPKGSEWSKRLHPKGFERGYYWASPAQVVQLKLHNLQAFEVKGGHFRGWYAFRTFADYMQAAGKSGVTLWNTGTLAEGLQIRPLGPTKLRVAFYGGRRKAKSDTLLLGGTDTWGRRSGQAKNNSDLARILSKRYEPLIDLGEGDMRKVNDLVRALFLPALLDMLRLAQVEYTARKKLRVRQRALARVLEDFKNAKQPVR